VELIDYCYRKFSVMVGNCEALADGEFIQPDNRFQEAKTMLLKSDTEEMEDQIKDVDFKCTMSCFSLIRFISDHLETLPVPIIH